MDETGNRNVQAFGGRMHKLKRSEGGHDGANRKRTAQVPCSQVSSVWDAASTRQADRTNMQKNVYRKPTRHRGEMPKIYTSKDVLCVIKMQAHGGRSPQRIRFRVRKFMESAGFGPN